MATVSTTLAPPRKVWNRRPVILVVLAVVVAALGTTTYLVLDDRAGSRTEPAVDRSAVSNEAPSVESIRRAREAETARWEGLVARDASLRARRAETARLTGLAESQGAIVLTRGQRADAARLTALAEYHLEHGLAGS